MYKKGLVMELKESYAIVMEPDGGMRRIRLKEGLKIGDEIYFLEEDIYPVTPERRKQTGGREGIYRLAAMAAVVFLTIGILASSLASMPAYAEISLDGENAVQIQVDEDYRIIDLVSENGSITEEQLKLLKGKALEDVTEELYRLIGKGPVLIGVVSKDEENQERVSQFTCKLFSERDLICLSGSREDLERAQEKDLSLGRYLVWEIREDEDLEEKIETMPTEEIQRILNSIDTKSDWYYRYEVREELEEELRDRQEDEEDWDEDEEDDEEEDEDDRQDEKEDD